MNVIIDLDRAAQERLAEALDIALRGSRQFRLSVDEIGLEAKWKIGEGTWSPGYGTLDPSSGVARAVEQYERRGATREQALRWATEGDRPGVTLTRDQLEAWVGYPLSDDQVQDLDDAVPNSSVPEAIATIAEGLVASS